MINQILAILPDDWIVQIYYIPRKKMSLEATMYPGIQKQLYRGRVILTVIQDSMRRMKKKELVSLEWFWDQAAAERVLMFGGNSVLCANSPWNVSSFERFAYIGAPWRSFRGRGGDGGFSLRSRSAVLDAIRCLRSDKGKGESINDVSLLRSMERGGAVLAEPEVMLVIDVMHILPLEVHPCIFTHHNCV
jgi:hypothetical protein